MEIKTTEVFLTKSVGKQFLVWNIYESKDDVVFGRNLSGGYFYTPRNGSSPDEIKFLNMKKSSFEEFKTKKQKYEKYVRKLERAIINLDSVVYEQLKGCVISLIKNQKFANELIEGGNISGNLGYRIGIKEVFKKVKKESLEDKTKNSKLTQEKFKTL